MGVPIPRLLLCVLALLAALATAAASQSPLSVRAELSTHDNATLAVFEEDRVSENFVAADLDLAWSARPTKNQLLSFRGTISGTLADRTSDLGHTDAGARLLWQAKTRLGADAPRFLARLGTVYQDFGSELRTGWLAEAAAGYVRPIGSRWTLGFDVAHTDRRAETEVFDQQAIAAQLDAEVKLGARTALLFGIRYRDGDVTSIATPGTIDPRVKPIKKVASALEFDDAFRGKIAYRLDATSWAGIATWSFDLGSSGSLQLDLEAERTDAINAIDYDAKKASFSWQRSF